MKVIRVLRVPTHEASIVSIVYWRVIMSIRGRGLSLQ